MTTDAREALHCEGCNGYVTLLEGTDLARDCPGWPERESAIRAEERQRANSTWTTNSGGVGATPTEAMAALREAAQNLVNAADSYVKDYEERNPDGEPLSDYVPLSHWQHIDALRAALDATTAEEERT